MAKKRSGKRRGGAGNAQPATPDHRREPRLTPAPEPQAREIVPPPTSGEGFINPYNFVSPGKPPERKAPRHTHEKFSGLSGRIICEFETLAPLCAPDAEASYRFDFRPGGRDEDKRWRKVFTRLENGTLCVAGSSIKGMLRSVAEGASNSCFAILTDELAIFRDNREHVTRPAAGRRLGQIFETTSDTLEFDDLYDNSRNFVPGGPRRGYPKTTNRDASLEKGLFGDCGMGQQPPPAWHWYRVPLRRDAAGSLRPNRTVSLPTEVKELYDRFSTKLVRAPHKKDKCTPGRRGQEYGPNDSRKGNDRWDRRPWLAGYLSHSNQDVFLWGQVSNSRAPGTLVSFGRNFRYKWAYDPRQALARLGDFLPCRRPAKVCACCDMFGMVEDRDEAAAATGQREVNAVAGKVAVSSACWVGGATETFCVADPKILGSPKYSCRPFYLVSDSGSFNVSRDEYSELNSGRVMPNPLRGRKFYWHHTRVCDAHWTSDDWTRYLLRRTREDDTPPPESAQNNQLELLMTGARFRFNVEFENLSSFQLGLLLWTLALPEVPGGAHHLGLGKPIGLGSIAVRIQSIELIDRARRYRSIYDTGRDAGAANAAAGTINVDDAPWNTYLNAFRSEMQNQNNGAQFDEIPNIADLCVILSRDQPAHATLPGRLRTTTENTQIPPVPITYPPGPLVTTEANDPHPEELHHNWFGRKEGKGKNWGERLLTIQEVARGCRQTPA